MAFEQFIRSEVVRLGFAAVGFAAIGPSQTFDRFKAWLNCGFAAGMAYMTRHVDLREDPSRLMSSAKSVIVVAARYPSDPMISPFSNYARGRDYHVILRGKLKQLARSLEAQSSVPFRARICVDSAPVLEREWAVRAGLGWIGKQGSLVNPAWGCALFLGELFINLELAPSKPKPSKCGTCQRCVEACPTGAIQPDGLVDARRCIAYLTIEHKGDIPEDLHPLLGASLFGCDRCTAVCPFNRAGRARSCGVDAILPEFNPAGTSMPTAEQCLTLSEADFQQRFRGTAVYRSGLARLKRNATIAMVNQTGCRL